MVQTVILIAFASSLFRASLNVIDRKLYGHLKGSVITLNFINNLLPFVLLIISCSIAGVIQSAIESILNLKTIAFALLVQLVAYSFAYAFRHAKIHQAIVYSKLSDIFIPIGIFFLTDDWSWVNYVFSVFTALACLPIMLHPHQTGEKHQPDAVLAIVVSLTLQGSLSSTLVEENNLLIESILFTVAVIFWRTSWSTVVLIFQEIKNQCSPGFLGSIKTLSTKSYEISQKEQRKSAKSMVKLETLKSLPRKVRKPQNQIPVSLISLVLLRSLISIATQVSFVLALSFKASAIAWPIFNSTSLFAVFLSASILHEKANKLEISVIIIIVILATIRFYIGGS